MLPHLKFSLDLFYDYYLGKVYYVYHNHLFCFVNSIPLNVCIPQSIFLPSTLSMQKSTQYINISASVFPSSVLDFSITAFIRTELTLSPVYNIWIPKYNCKVLWYYFIYIWTDRLHTLFYGLQNSLDNQYPLKNINWEYTIYAKNITIKCQDVILWNCPYNCLYLCLLSKVLNILISGDLLKPSV